MVPDTSHLDGAAAAAAPRLIGITLIPERGDLGLEAIEITGFPFLVSKSDDTFARYRERYPHQVNYLSRRHAHIFLKGGQPHVEDLGSTNGTFVAGRRLDEHAVPLAAGDTLAFGGHHFVYRVSLQEEKALDPTATRGGLPGGNPGGEAAGLAGGPEKTTFVAAADSFLDIFCVEPESPPADEAPGESPDAVLPGPEKGQRQRGRTALFISELAAAFAGAGGGSLRRGLRWGGAALVVLALLAAGLYHRGAAEREVKEGLADGDYARAAVAADRYLARHPGHGEMKALGLEALLKAHVPAWVSQLEARDFEGAAATLAGLQAYGSHNPEVRPLLAQLQWFGEVERYFIGRGGAEAPIRIFADEERIRALLKPWQEDVSGHQRTFDRVAALVPEFRDFYPEALSHLRKLQSDDSVYLAAIDRLKAAIRAGSNRNHPEALAALLQEYQEKYPRLAGLDELRRQEMSQGADGSGEGGSGGKGDGP